MLDWLTEHRTMIYWTMGVTGVLVVASLILAPVVIVKLPADYLAKHSGEQGTRGVATRKRSGLGIARNILGWVLMVAGVAMLILPGPGVVVALIGIAMADFPGKARLLRWVLSRGRILKSANRLRRRFGRPPLDASAA